MIKPCCPPELEPVLGGMVKLTLMLMLFVVVLRVVFDEWLCDLLSILDSSWPGIAIIIRRLSRYQLATRDN